MKFERREAHDDKEIRIIWQAGGATGPSISVVYNRRSEDVRVFAITRGGLTPKQADLFGKALARATEEAQELQAGTHALLKPSAPADDPPTEEPGDATL